MHSSQKRKSWPHLKKGRKKLLKKWMKIALLVYSRNEVTMVLNPILHRMSATNKYLCDNNFL